MNDRQRQQLVEQCEEAELTLLMYDYAREEGRQLAKEYDEAQKNGTLPEVPEELDRKCRALIDGTFAKMERKTRLKRIVRSAARAAAVLFVVLGVMATTVMSVDALRVPVINFLMDTSEKYSRIQFDTEDTNIKSEDNQYSVKLESNIPEGYRCKEKNISSEYFGFIQYVNSDDNSIVFNFFPTSTERLIDTEGVEIDKIEIGVYSVALVEKNGYSVVWTDLDNKVAYSLFANGLDFETFWKIVCAILAE